MTNQGAVIFAVNSHISRYVDNTHSDFRNKDYDAYSIAFDITGKNPRTNSIAFITFSRKHKNKYTIHRIYRNIHNATMLEMVKEHQHIGHWDGDEFIISNDIKRGGK